MLSFYEQTFCSGHLFCQKTFKSPQKSSREGIIRKLYNLTQKVSHKQVLKQKFIVF